MKKKWSKEEIDYLRKNYSSKTNIELQVFLKRSEKGMHFQATKLGLKKDKETYCRSHKHKKIFISKELLFKLYNEESKSIRKIAKELKLGKNTISYYLNKYDISRRNISQANKLFYQSGGKIWKKGLTKEMDKRILLATIKMKENYAKKRIERVRRIEKEIGMSLKETINKFYWTDGLTQEEISKKLKIGRGEIIKLMKDYDISKKPNFRVIANLKGEKHSMHGKTWEEIYGSEEAARFKKERSIASRRNIIRRLQNKEMPFFSTKIEVLLAEELSKRKIPFISQYNVNNKFVCDFGIPKYKIIIECDGNYWHGNPAIYKKSNLSKAQIKNIRRDKFKDIYLKKRGWTILRFFESEILKSVPVCADEIEKQIKEIAN